MQRSRTQQGFTLVEMAIVLLIVGLLTRTLLNPIMVAQQHKGYNVTRSHLLQVKDSLLAHIVAHGYLPCPITTATARYNSAAYNKDAICDIEQGFVPAVKLGLSGPMNSQGALLDVWNRPYRYAVSLSNHGAKGDQSRPDWTTPGEASNVGLRNLSSRLVLCVESSRSRCVQQSVRADNLAFVVLSLGQDVSDTGDQSENQDGDETFLMNAFSIRSESPFDDQLVWSSTQDILYWMLRAGWLP